MVIPSTIQLHQIMTTDVVTVAMDEGLRVVRKLFEERGFHHLLVVDGRRLAGVISDRDLLRNLSPFLGHDLTERAQDAATLNKRAHQIMSRKPVTARTDTPLSDAVRLILDHRISCLPVTDEQMHPLGIVTWRDILKTFNA